MLNMPKIQCTSFSRYYGRYGDPSTNRFEVSEKFSLRAFIAKSFSVSYREEPAAFSLSQIASFEIKALVVF